MDASNTGLRFDEAERGFVLSVGRRYFNDEHAADDVAQEAMLLAYRYRDTFRGDSHPRTWLYRIAMTTAIGYRRRQHRQLARVVPVAPADLAELPAPSQTLSPEESLASRELGDALERGLDELDAKYSEVLRLRAKDLRDSEIAKLLGLTVATVKIRAHRARAMMRQVLPADLAAAA